jgi:hypothetical protein
MLRNKFLEALTTRHLTLTVVLILILTIGSFGVILSFKLAGLDTLSKFVDAVFKASAVLLGVVWTLNRYYVGRTDELRFRIDPEIKVIRFDKSAQTGPALLVFRLDTVNTGSVLIPRFQESVEIESVVPTADGVRYDSLYRWPSEGKHAAGPIEPDAWDAINDAISIPATVRAVRIYIEAEISKGDGWTWHKTFDVSKPDSKN